jgi:two-component system sensor histidine kinase UhpB
MRVFLVLAQRRALARERQYAQELLRAQEEERAWVAREVHDDAVQRLAAIANELSEVLPGTRAGETPNRVSGIVGEVQDLGVTLRKLAHGLHPSAIDKGGIVPALQQLAADLANAHGLGVDLLVEQPPAGLSRNSELALYRIAQESLRNVARHAGVQRATLRLGRAAGTTVMEVADQGRGMVSTPGRRGIGLRSMDERARLAGGQLSVVSRPGEGTTITVRMPERSRGES